MARTSMKSFGTSNRIGHDSTVFYNRKLYDESVQTRKKISANNSNKNNKLLETNKIYQHSSESMSEIPDNCIHLMVTSPPYNVGKDYEDDLSLKDYLAMLKNVWKETYRVLAPGGKACINVANVGRKPYLPLNYKIGNDMMDIGFLMRGEIIWNKSASAGTSCAWGSWRSPSNPVLRDTHEYIMVFCKEEFGRKDVKGKESTISKDDFLSSTKSIWDMQTESAKKAKHPAPFPIALPFRLIQLYTYKHEIILDPFMGSGSTAIAAEKSERKWVGYEISKEYVDNAYERIKEHSK